MNGGRVETDNDFLIKFKDEIKLIHKNVCALNPELFKSIKLRKEYNPEGSMMNVILCKIENELLLTAIQYLKSIDYNVDVLVFDGFMVRKEDGKPITDEFLSNTSSYVK